MAYLQLREGCTRCGGKGYISKFVGIDDGICYKCMNISADDVKSVEHFRQLVAERRERYGDPPL